MFVTHYWTLHLPSGTLDKHVFDYAIPRSTALEQVNRWNRLAALNLPVIWHYWID